MIKISILICSLEERKNELTLLLLNLMRQCKEYSFKDTVIDRQGALTITTYTFDEVEIITATDNRQITTGAKRNMLYERAKGKYSISVDDDDEVPVYYIEELLAAAEQDVDCFAINGTITTNGNGKRRWYISKDLDYVTETIENEIYYTRYPNHITAIRSEIAKKFIFPDKVFAEDFAWATQIHNSRLIKTEVMISKPMYFYKYKTKK